jgi:hypothetical protein
MYREPCGRAAYRLCESVEDIRPKGRIAGGIVDKSNNCKCGVGWIRHGFSTSTSKAMSGRTLFIHFIHLDEHILIEE